MTSICIYHDFPHYLCTLLLSLVRFLQPLNTLLLRKKILVKTLSTTNMALWTKVCMMRVNSLSSNQLNVLFSNILFLYQHIGSLAFWRQRWQASKSLSESRPSRCFTLLMRFPLILFKPQSNNETYFFKYLLTSHLFCSVI